MNIKEILLSLFIFAVLFGSVAVGIKRTEIYDCLTWQKQAKEYSNFYLVKWQQDQCDAHHITIK